MFRSRFLQDVLDEIDGWWFIAGFFLVPVGVLALIAWIPLVIGFVWLVVVTGLYEMGRTASQTYRATDNEHWRHVSYELRIKATILLISVGAVYVWYIHHVLSDPEMMCKDLTGYIPGTMQGLLQKLVPHSC